MWEKYFLRSKIQGNKWDEKYEGEWGACLSVPWYWRTLMASRKLSGIGSRHVSFRDDALLFLLQLFFILFPLSLSLSLQEAVKTAFLLSPQPSPPPPYILRATPPYCETLKLHAPPLIYRLMIFKRGRAGFNHLHPLLSQPRIYNIPCNNLFCEQ